MQTFTIPCTDDDHLTVSFFNSFKIFMNNIPNTTSDIINIPIGGNTLHTVNFLFECFNILKHI